MNMSARELYEPLLLIHVAAAAAAWASFVLLRRFPHRCWRIRQGLPYFQYNKKLSKFKYE